MAKFLVFSCLAFLVACSPMGPLPGGELSGTVQAIPHDWSASLEMPIVQVQTRPNNPYSINIWGVAHESNFYIGSGGGEESAWVGHLAEDPSIRLRLGTNLYLLKAVRVRNETEQALVRGLYLEKYEDFEEQASSEQAADEMVVFRLDPR